MCKRVSRIYYEIRMSLICWVEALKEKKTQSKCMFRLGDDNIESPYNKFLDTFDFFV